MKIGLVGKVWIENVRNIEENVEIWIFEIEERIRWGMDRIILLDKGRGIIEKLRKKKIGWKSELLKIGEERKSIEEIGIGIRSNGGGMRIGNILGKDEKECRMGRKERWRDIKCDLKGIGRNG